MKPGWRTTEFWLSLVPIVLGSLAASGAMGDGWAMRGLGVATDLLAALGYTASRTAVKRGWCQNEELLRQVQRESQQAYTTLGQNPGAIPTPAERGQ